MRGIAKQAFFLLLALLLTLSFVACNGGGDDNGEPAPPSYGDNIIDYENIE